MADFELDTSYVLYIFAALFLLVTVMYFGIEVVFQLSPVTKSFLLLSMTSIIIGAGVWFRTGLNSILAYVSGFLSYIVFLAYTLLRFDPGTEAVLGSLAASAVLFAVAGKLINDGQLELSTKGFRYLTIGIIAAAALLTGFDMLGAQPEYEVQFEDQKEIVEGENRIGEITVGNSFLFSRSYELPDYRSCTFSPNRSEHYLDVADYRTDSGTIAGGKTKTFDINFTSRTIAVNPDNPQVREPEISGPYQIEEVSNCPSSGESDTIYVYPHGSENQFID